MYLDTILFFENTPLKDLTESKEKSFLLNLKVKLLDIEHLLIKEPEGSIKLMTNSIVTLCFSDKLEKLISERIHS